MKPKPLRESNHLQVPVTRSESLKKATGIRRTGVAPPVSGAGAICDMATGTALLIDDIIVNISLPSKEDSDVTYVKGLVQTQRDPT